MKKILFPILALVLAVGLALPMAAAADPPTLVVNGSFEAPVITENPSSCGNKNWQIFGSGGNNAGPLPGWSVVALYDATAGSYSWTAGGPGALEFQNASCGAGWHPYEGDQYAELDADVDGPCGTHSGEKGSVRIYQDLDTVAGGIYELSFAFAPRPGYGTNDNKLEVNWNEDLLVILKADGTIAQQGSQWLDTNTVVLDNGWWLCTCTVTANSDTTRLQFADAGIPNSLGTFLDDVEVVLIEIEVKIDIKPASCPNPLNVKSKGVLPVAILGTADFDVTQVNPNTIKLEGVEPVRWAVGDVATPFEGKIIDCDDCTTAGPDGYNDLTLKFDKQAVVEAIGGNVQNGQCVTLTLTGKLQDDGGSFTGEDKVVILKKGKGK